MISDSYDKLLNIKPKVNKYFLFILILIIIIIYLFNKRINVNHSVYITSKEDYYIVNNIYSSADKVKIDNRIYKILLLKKNKNENVVRIKMYNNKIVNKKVNFISKSKVINVLKNIFEKKGV